MIVEIDIENWKYTVPLRTIEGINLERRIYHTWSKSSRIEYDRPVKETQENENRPQSVRGENTPRGKADRHRLPARAKG